MFNSSVRIEHTFSCGEDYEKMKATKCGRFCNRCATNVLDITAKSDDEIYCLAIKHGGSFCARLLPSQANRELQLEDRSKLKIVPRWIAGSIAMFGLLESKADIQPSVQIVCSTPKHVTALDTIQPTHVDSAQYSIRGIITDMYSKEGIPSVLVFVEGVSLGAVSDESGRFDLQIPLDSVSDPFLLKFQHISYLSHEVNMTHHQLRTNPEIGVELKVEKIISMIGVICVNKPKWYEFRKRLRWNTRRGSKFL